MPGIIPNTSARMNAFLLLLPKAIPPLSGMIVLHGPDRNAIECCQVCLDQSVRMTPLKELPFVLDPPFPLDLTGSDQDIVNS